MIDGRHVGTGGGNHVVLGGAAPADSPFLRRPDLLQQPAGLLAATIRRCPTCSPGCSSGPPARRRASTRPATTASTSWRSRWPRCPDAGSGICPAVAGRPPVPAHLLVDITGNTHRAEICIDKLYSPDGPTGRLGLVEFRALEMPPDPRMSLAQQLLIRALIAKFWREPQQAASSCAGAPRCTTASCCRISSGRIFSTCLRRAAAAPATISRRIGTRPARIPLSCLRPGPPRRRRAGIAAGAGALARARRGGLGRRHGALVDIRSSGCRSRPRALSTAATSSPATAAGCR